MNIYNKIQQTDSTDTAVTNTSVTDTSVALAIQDTTALVDTSTKDSTGITQTAVVDYSVYYSPPAKLPDIDTLSFAFNDSLNTDETNFYDNYLRIKTKEKKEALKDTIIKKEVIKETKAEKTIIEEKPSRILNEYDLLRPADYEESYDWLTAVLVSSILIFGLARLFFGKILSLYLKEVFSFQKNETIKSVKNSRTLRFSNILTVLFIINISVFITEMLHYYEQSIMGYQLHTSFFIIIVSIIALYLAKFISLLIAGLIFNTIKQTNQYIRIVFLYNRIYSIFLYPIILPLPFIDPEHRHYLIFFGVIIFAFLFIMRALRGLVLGIQNRLSIFFIILYLCTLEFLPLIVIYKAFMLLI